MSSADLRPRLLLELLWWLITALVVYMVLSPIYSVIHSYPFLTENIVFIAVFITLSRYVFLLKYSFFSQLLPVKLLLLFGSLILLIYLFSCMYGFQVFMNESGFEGFIPLLRDPENTSPDKLTSIYSYFRSEMLFFASSSIIITIITPVRMVVSVWRVYNKTGKV